MPTVREHLANPRFQELPLIEQQKVLQQVDPNFGGLPEEEQLRFLDMLKGSSTPGQRALTKGATPTGIAQEFGRQGKTLLGIAESTALPIAGSMLPLLLGPVGVGASLASRLARPALEILGGGGGEAMTQALGITEPSPGNIALSALTPPVARVVAGGAVGLKNALMRSTPGVGLAQGERAARQAGGMLATLKPATASDDLFDALATSAGQQEIVPLTATRAFQAKLAGVEKGLEETLPGLTSPAVGHLTTVPARPSSNRTERLS